MRDYKRPDRIALREMAQSGGRRRQRTQESTPMIEMVNETLPSFLA